MTHSQTLALEHRKSKIAINLVIILAGSIFLALLSQVAIPLPFTPVPLTLQTLGVFILGGVLGSRRAMYSVLAYLLQGSCGLPVFAAGAAGPLWLLDVKAGFLVSFVIATFLIGKLIEKRPQAGLFYLVCSLLLGQIVISTIGMLWLSLYVGLSKAFIFGVLPFLSGAAVKISTGALLLKGYALCRKGLTS